MMTCLMLFASNLRGCAGLAELTPKRIVSPKAQQWRYASQGSRGKGGTTLVCPVTRERDSRVSDRLLCFILSGIVAFRILIIHARRLETASHVSHVRLHMAMIDAEPLGLKRYS